MVRREHLSGQRIGYIRVSSFDQNPERQLDDVAVDRTFTDKASGKDVQRPALEELCAFVRHGDTVVVHSMDRLARNLDDLRRTVQELTKRGVRMEFVKEGLVFTGDNSPMATLMLSVMGAFAEFERALIRERQREGITLARQRGASVAARNPCRRSGSKSCAAAPPPERSGCILPKTSASAAKPYTNI